MFQVIFFPTRRQDDEIRRAGFWQGTRKNTNKCSWIYVHSKITSPSKHFYPITKFTAELSAGSNTRIRQS